MVLQKVLDGRNEHCNNYPLTQIGSKTAWNIPKINKGQVTGMFFQTHGMELRNVYYALLGVSFLTNNENLGFSILLLEVLINFDCKHCG